jgi:hypothetical protein
VVIGEACCGAAALFSMTAARTAAAGDQYLNYRSIIYAFLEIINKF